MTGPQQTIDTVSPPAAHFRPLHLRWHFIALVALGGAVGTAAREGLALAVPDFGGLPTTIFGINVVGAFLLGLLLETLALAGPDAGGRRVLRLLVGTGMLGGFTTYSTFATGAGLLLDGGSIWLSVLYGVGTVVIGAAATFGGIVLAASVHNARSRRREVLGRQARGRGEEADA
ncbi:CrcB family protein [Microbacterium sp. STN6]|uniref:fluoride efflux transporter FluC n=1 Tax=Microbacterium sp. STN6 TaxID=2995588 RepID=UPI002260DB66|nr:CrcB family protein [Microbacterium sp. STN6]MCX7520878.1 CrcB family protein [Microbacterium sp. STN6]